MDRARRSFGRIALTVTAGLLAAVTPAVASSRIAAASVPAVGDWEGVGPHGLPLSFALARRHRHVVATAIAVGYPGGCPATKSDGYVIPLVHVGYSGPGGLHSVVSFFAAPGSASLSGRVRGVSGSWLLTGRFATRRSGTLASAAPAGGPGCGWPKRELTWRVHRGRRVAIADGHWSGQVSGPNITGGTVTAFVAAGGRAVTHFAASFQYACPDGGYGPENFEATWGEFISPGGSFGSPQDDPISVDGVTVSWAGAFSPTGLMTGSLTTAGPAACGPTPQSTVRVSFTAQRVSG
jgi:hypothetical protein